MMIFFDIDETLIDQRKAEAAAGARLLEAYGGVLTPFYSADEFCRVWRLLREKHNRAFLSGRISFAEQRRRRMRDLFAGAGRDLTDAEAETASAFFEEHYRRNWLLFSDVLPALESLRGYGRGVISNGCTERQTLKLRQMGIERYFQVIVVSQSAGAAKPSREIFFEACHRARVPAQHAVFVGDRLEEDALAARAAGLRAFWLDRRRTGAPAPVETIGALTDLAGKLDLRIAV